jgi:hypothetical protein
MDGAKADPSAMGWLAAGYLAGVEVGRKSGPCGAIMAWPGGILVCALGHAHVGAHQTAGPTSWNDPAEAVPSPAPDGVVSHG